MCALVEVLFLSSALKLKTVCGENAGVSAKETEFD